MVRNHSCILSLIILMTSILLNPYIYAQNNHAIDFGSSNAHVTFKNNPQLGLQTFTIELWLKRLGIGSSASTGNGGIIAIPLVTKGRDQSEGNNRDLNYFLGIRDSDNVLAADFEDYSAGNNHPIAGTTVISYNTWYHAAVTYDGSKLKLYLNGILEAEINANETPRWDSIQHAAVATAKNSIGISKGHFDGIIDEVRIWDHAISKQEILNRMNKEIQIAPGLVSRWGFNEGHGTTVFDSSGHEINGSILGMDWNWTNGAPLETSFCPDQPILNSPSDGAGDVSTSPVLEVSVSDAEEEDLTVTFYGRKELGNAIDFTLVALPDTQYYSENYPEIFTAQTQWIVDSKEELNISFVTHLGDIVEHIDMYESEWINANNSMSILDGHVPYGLLPGNHDMNLEGIAIYYDKYFPASRYDAYAWYGGFYRNNKNNFELFSVGILDIIIVHLEWNPTDDVLAWADNVLKSYPERRAIISTHDYLDMSGNRSNHKSRPDGNTGEEIWNKLIKQNCNVFMVLNGHHHFPGCEAESRLTSTNDCGDDVHQMLQNYQDDPNGGNSWLRYYNFKTSDNKIHAYTYSPTLEEFEIDDNSQFTLNYPMGGVEFEVIDINYNVPSGTTTSAVWDNIDYETKYEWYVTVNDGSCTTTGPIWTFTTEQDCSDPTPDDATCNVYDDDCDGTLDEDYLSMPSTCGTGECNGNTGELICQEGEEIDTCDPFYGSMEEICGDNLDNDCDGSIDEDFIDTDNDASLDCIDPDDDNDGVPDDGDNCPLHMNADQLDSDNDNIGDVCDACPYVPNAYQVDSDGDSCGDACDNCLQIHNSTQIDFDDDNVGDHCDLDDGLIYILFNGPYYVEWQEEIGYDSWNLYKGELNILKWLDLYTQDPHVIPIAKTYCGLTDTICEDSYNLPKNKVAYFLVTGAADGVESSLGTNSEGIERKNDNPCL